MMIDDPRTMYHATKLDGSGRVHLAYSRAVILCSGRYMSDLVACDRLLTCEVCARKLRRATGVEVTV